MVEGEAPARPGGAESLGELLVAFSSVTSMGLGLGTEHGIRTCYIGMSIANDLELPPERAADVYYTALAKDGGCTCGTSQMAEFLGADERDAIAEYVQLDPDNELQMLRWVFRHAGRGGGAVTRIRRTLDALVHGARFEHENAVAECEVAQRAADRLGLSKETRDALTACTERWDGKGLPFGRSGDAIPLAARIVNLSAAVEIAHRLSGPESARVLVVERAGKSFDPRITGAFLGIAEHAAFWAQLEDEGLRERVLALEPAEGPTPVGAIERFTTVIGDLVDLRRPATAGHSRRVADLADRVASRLDLAAGERVALRRAALIHGAGLLAMSAHALARGDADVAYRSHPLVAAQLLGEVASLRSACEIAAGHHERTDGSGWPAGSEERRQSRSARILAGVCAFDERAGGVDGAPADAALESLVAGGGFDAAVLDAIAAAAGAPRPAAPPEQRPAGLTEREIEVLRLAAAGLSVREIGTRLVISHHTARHHLESTYGKIGCSSRAAAALFAAEHGLLDSLRS